MVSELIYRGHESQPTTDSYSLKPTKLGQGCYGPVYKGELSQHRSLVCILGCCVQNEEYMSNKSLDYFIFDETRKSLLDWKKRHEIILGIGRGILYLHQDSRLRIIRRDLKASNILLDEELNPKISDFGTARVFGGNQDEANTARVVETYGYMSSEYALGGLFSIKSDVFSFGVLLIEIINGTRNSRYSHD